MAGGGGGGGGCVGNTGRGGRPRRASSLTAGNTAAPSTSQSILLPFVSRTAVPLPGFSVVCVTSQYGSCLSLRVGSRFRDTDIAGVNLDVRDGEHRVGNAILFFRLVQQPIAGAEDSHFDIRIFSGEPYSILARLVGNRVTTVAVGGVGAEVVLDGERIDIVGLDRQALDARIGLGIYDQACNSSVGHATLGPFLEGEVHPLGERVFEEVSDALGQTLLFVSHHGPCALESS